MKNGTVKISCALAALALVITAGLSGYGANSGDANSATQQSSASGQNNEAGKKSVVKTPDLSKISWNVDPAAEGRLRGGDGGLVAPDAERAGRALSEWRCGLSGGDRCHRDGVEP